MRMAYSTRPIGLDLLYLSPYLVMLGCFRRQSCASAVHILTLLLRMQTYNPRSSLTTLTFWKNGVFMAAVDAAICFFIPYYAITTNGQHDANDEFSVGKTVFVALLGTVSLEVGPVYIYLFPIFRVSFSFYG